ncbi:hypothetical protein OROHE_017278 [Orobanche hederae]
MIDCLHSHFHPPHHRFVNLLPMALAQCLLALPPETIATKSILCPPLSVLSFSGSRKLEARNFSFSPNLLRTSFQE